MLINSYAKINLFLDVINKRNDGYHEIDTLFSTINLHDSLKFVLTKKPDIQILSNIPELASINNLVYKIAQRILRDFKVNQGIEIFLDKRIPVAAGLGGGSSNAAVTLIALNAILDLNMKEEYMHSVAAEYGSDINFFFYGGLARGSSRGEIVTPLSDIPEMELLLVNPGIAVSSSEAYQLLEFPAIDEIHSDMWFNRLERGVVKKYPRVGMILDKMYKFGAEKAIMSGSGSTCIGYFRDKLLQSKAKANFDSENIWSEIVKTTNREEYQECFQNLS